MFSFLPPPQRSPFADLKFGAKFSHDNTVTDSLGISTTAQHCGVGVSSSWHPSSSQHCHPPLHQLLQACMWGWGAPALDPHNCPLLPNCPCLGPSLGKGELHPGEELEELNGTVLGRENKRVIGKASSCDQGLNRNQAFSLHPSRENKGICAGSRRPSASMRPPPQAARHGRAHPLPLAALCIHLPYVCLPAGT